MGRFNTPRPPQALALILAIIILAKIARDGDEFLLNSLAMLTSALALTSDGALIEIESRHNRLSWTAVRQQVDDTGD